MASKTRGFCGSQIRPIQLVHHFSCFFLFSILCGILIVLWATLDKECFDPSSKECAWHCVATDNSCSWCSNGWVVPLCAKNSFGSGNNAKGTECESKHSCSACQASENCHATSGISYITTLVMLVVALVVCVVLFIATNTLIIRYAEDVEALGDNDGTQLGKRYEYLPEEQHSLHYPSASNVKEPLLTRRLQATSVEGEQVSHRGSKRVILSENIDTQVDLGTWNRLRHASENDERFLSPEQVARRQMDQWGYL